MPRKKGSHHGRGKKSERLEYGLRYEIDRTRFAGEDLNEVKQRAKDHFLKTEGKSQLHGVHIIGRWRNPDNKNPLHSDWKTTDDPGHSLSAFYRTFHGQRGALRQLATLPTPRVPAKPIAAPSKRVTAMKKYWSAIRKIRKQHPRFSLARARKEYRKRR